MSISSIELGRKLLVGDVICPWTSPMEHRHLSDPSVQEAFNHNFRFLGASLSTITSETGSSFYLTMSPDSGSIEKRSREVFSTIMRNIRPTMEWLNIFMTVMHPDRVILGGEDLRLSDLFSTVSSNVSLQESLNRIPRLKGETVKKQLEHLITDLKKEGILMDLNVTHDIYRFTGKIDLINEYLIFITEHEQIDVEDAAPEQQGHLL
ncbi:MAG: hypothetical protein HRT92_03780 [Piscirickettsiaceae bacterium]|nr:hypothetical protein [Piscirickettsiaceae bacterium]